VCIMPGDDATPEAVLPSVDVLKALELDLDFQIMPSGAEGTPSLADFYKSRRTRRGRGAIQEALLLFGFYLQAVEGNVEFSIEQVGGCFGVVGLDLPKNLHHAVGTLKRKHGWFEEGSKRGRYRVSSEGLKLVRPL
ncbi:MAG: hypothetical protein ACE10D_02965, partial [Planctomycetota bacterium]